MRGSETPAAKQPDARRSSSLFDPTNDKLARRLRDPGGGKKNSGTGCGNAVLGRPVRASGSGGRSRSAAGAGSQGGALFAAFIFFFFFFFCFFLPANDPVTSDSPRISFSLPRPVGNDEKAIPRQPIVPPWNNQEEAGLPGAAERKLNCRGMEIVHAPLSFR